MKKTPWRKILRSMGYHKQTKTWGKVTWVNSAKGAVLVASLIPKNNTIDYIKGMEECYKNYFYNWHMEMESIWTEGETV